MHEEIKRIFEDIKEGSIAYRELAQKTTVSTDRTQWLQALREQSEQGAAIYDRSAKALEKLNVILAGEWNQKDADTALEYCVSIYLEDWADEFLLLQCAESLLPFYEEKHDIANTILLLSIICFCLTVLAHLTKNHSLGNYVEYCEKILSYQNDPFLLTDEKAARRVIIAYYNICIVAVTVNQEMAPIAWEYYDKLSAWIKTPFFKELYAKYEFVEQEINDILEPFFTYFYDVDEKYLTKQQSKMIYKHLEAFWENNNFRDKEALLACESFDNVLRYLYLQMKKNPKNGEAYLQLAIEYYQSKCDTIGQDSFLLTGFYTYAVLFMKQGMDYLSLSKEKYRQYRDYLVQLIERYIQVAQERTGLSSLLTFSIISLCFEQQIVNMFDTNAEKIDFLFRLFIKRHISTYLHSNMVSEFARCIAGYALDHAPELFICPGLYDSAAEITAHKDEILQLLHWCAQIHDVGKIAIQDVISRQYRPLFDNEFSLIETHPEIGHEFLLICNGLEMLCDSAIGHHKSYDGKEGYPVQYDNTKSEIRILVDIITLADCLDAATDSLGRNYRTPKKVEEVAAEFAESAGTKYHPQLADMIAFSPALLQELEEIAGPRRKDLFYQIFRNSPQEITLGEII